MTIHEAYKQMLFQLYELYDDREAANIADMIIEHITAQKKIDRIVNKQMQVSAQQQQQLEEYTRQLLRHTPVQYVLHEAWFAGMKLYVDENVLIPRPETEELTNWIADCGLQIADFVQPVTKGEAELQLGNTKHKTRNIKLLDVGTGSGCIPIALKKKFSQWDVHALDISPGTLQVAEKNALFQRAAISFHLTDILDESGWQQLSLFDVIVSNPPYITESEASTMHNNVLAFEPRTALFVPDNDALLFYKKIADFALLHLNQNGLLFFEINESSAKEVCEMLAAKGFSDVELRKDLQGKERMVKASAQLHTKESSSTYLQTKTNTR